MTDQQTPGQRQHRAENTENTKSPRAPFDTSELANIPRPTDEDPPYQSWWVITGPDDR